MKVLYESDKDIVEKVLKSQAFYDDDKRSLPFKKFCQEIIVEVYGKPQKDWFDSNSHMDAWFTSRHNLIESLLNRNFKMKDKHSENIQS